MIDLTPGVVTIENTSKKSIRVLSRQGFTQGFVLPAKESVSFKAETSQDLIAFLAQEATIRGLKVTLPADQGVAVSSSSDLMDALKNGENAILASDVSVSMSTFAQLQDSGETVTVDLNGNTLTFTGNSSMDMTDLDLTIKDGEIATDFSGVSSSLIKLDGTSNLVLSNVTADIECVLALARENSKLSISNSTINTTAAYAIGTNASNDDSPVINISNCELTSASTTLFLVVNGDFTISNSIINGSNQCILARGGKTIIKNCTLNYSKADDDSDKYCSDPSSWGSGNAVAAGAIVIGNNDNKGYNYDADITITNTTINSDSAIEEDQYLYDIYGIGNIPSKSDGEYYQTNLKIDKATLNTCKAKIYLAGQEDYEDELVDTPEGAMVNLTIT